MERTANMPYMVVTLDVSKLSGWLKNGACCRESKGGHTVRGEVRAGRREAVGDHGVRSVQGRARLQIIGAGGAHVEHEVHVCDFGGVEAQRLVERRRLLPRVETRAGRGAGWEAGGGKRRRCKQRTLNISYMFVTLEVSQLETSASKFFKSLKRSLMSVMAETHQSAMGPYVAVAAAGFAS